jgi:type IV pilus assembly protein PilW
MKDTLMQHHESDGFTLIEVLVALAVSGVILTSVFMAFKSQHDNYLTQDQVVEMQENIRAGVGIMAQELRMAGYDPYNTGNIGIVTAAANSVSFTLVADSDNLDNDNDGTIDEQGELDTVTFSFSDTDGDGDMDIGRQDSVNAMATLAENFDGLEFNYLDENNNQTANLNRIESIQISVLARSDQPDSKFSNNSTYTPASGSTAAPWGAYNDNFRRRFQIITVHLRNMDT